MYNGIRIKQRRYIMGWQFIRAYDERNDLKKLVVDLTKSTKNCTCIAHCVRGTVLWSVWESKLPTTKRFINCDLTEFGGHYVGLGYKSLDEDMGPNHLSCPPSYIKMATPPMTQISKDWRANVLEYHAERKALRAKRK